MCIRDRVSDVAAEGTVRGFYVDGSRDGDYEDGAGRMQVKWYSYSGIESQVSQGDWVVVEGILMQSDASSPYTCLLYTSKSGWLPALTKRWLFIHRPAQRVGVHHESHAKCYLVRRLERKDP